MRSEGRHRFPARRVRVLVTIWWALLLLWEVNWRAVEEIEDAAGATPRKWLPLSSSSSLKGVVCLKTSLPRLFRRRRIVVEIPRRRIWVGNNFCQYLMSGRVPRSKPLLSKRTAKKLFQVLKEAGEDWQRSDEEIGTTARAGAASTDSIKLTGTPIVWNVSSNFKLRRLLLDERIAPERPAKGKFGLGLDRFLEVAVTSVGNAVRVFEATQATDSSLVRKPLHTFSDATMSFKCAAKGGNVKVEEEKLFGIAYFVTEKLRNVARAMLSCIIASSYHYHSASLRGGKPPFSAELLPKITGEPGMKPIYVPITSKQDFFDMIAIFSTLSKRFPKDNTVPVEDPCGPTKFGDRSFLELFEKQKRDTIFGVIIYEDGNATVVPGDSLGMNGDENQKELCAHSDAEFSFVRSLFLNSATNSEEKLKKLVFIPQATNWRDYVQNLSLSELLPESLKKIRAKQATLKDQMRRQRGASNSSELDRVKMDRDKSGGSVNLAFDSEEHRNRVNSDSSATDTTVLLRN